jgi:hypothetical protein
VLNSGSGRNLCLLFGDVRSKVSGTESFQARRNGSPDQVVAIAATSSGSKLSCGSKRDPFASEPYATCAH